MKYIVLSLFLVTSFLAEAQRFNGGKDFNLVGIQGRYTQAFLSTSNFDTNSLPGFSGGLNIRARLRDRASIVYGIDFVASNLSVPGRPLGQTEFEDVEYELKGAQLNFFWSYNLLEDRLSGFIVDFDLGPALLINSPLKVSNSGQSDNILKGYTVLKATDIEEISRFNFLGVVALSAGYRAARLTVQYQYGINNTLEELNEGSLERIDPAAGNFKGNASFLSLGLAFYLH